MVDHGAEGQRADQGADAFGIDTPEGFLNGLGDGHDGTFKQVLKVQIKAASPAGSRTRIMSVLREPTGRCKVLYRWVGARGPDASTRDTTKASLP